MNVEKQGVIKKNDWKTMVFNYLSGWVQWLDHAIFKVVVDYIIRNFDPTGVSVWGIIDSFCYILIKPRLPWFGHLFNQGNKNCKNCKPLLFDVNGRIVLNSYA